MSYPFGTGIRLDSLPREEVKQWIESFDNILTDCDGVLWVFQDVIGEGPKVINRLKEKGKGVFFVTNNSTKTREEFAAKAVEMKFNVSRDDIISSSFMVAQYLHQRGFDKEAYVIGSEGVAKELDAVNISHHGLGPDETVSDIQKYLKEEFKLNPNVGAVIVGFDEYFNFKKMTKACSYLDNPECFFLATNTDEGPAFETPGSRLPKSGAILVAVETAAERKAVILGKPFSHAREILTKKYNIDPERTLMIGDRGNTDVLFGKNCGFKTLLVETGFHTEKDVRKWQQSGDEGEQRQVPDFITSSLTDLLQYLD